MSLSLDLPNRGMRWFLRASSYCCLVEILYVDKNAGFHHFSTKLAKVIFISSFRFVFPSNLARSCSLASLLLNSATGPSTSERLIGFNSPSSPITHSRHRATQTLRLE